MVGKQQEELDQQSGKKAFSVMGLKLDSLRAQRRGEAEAKLSAILT